jgi:hypothetical protein
VNGDHGSGRVVFDEFISLERSCKIGERWQARAAFYVYEHNMA